MVLQLKSNLSSINRFWCENLTLATRNISLVKTYKMINVRQTAISLMFPRNTNLK